MASCIFCKIANKEIPSEFIYEDDFVVAFPDVNPVSPIHILIVPKQHFETILDAPLDIKGHVLNAIKYIAKKLNVEDNGFRLVNNCKDDGGQEILHLHFHFLAGRKYSWPPG